MSIKKLYISKGFMTLALGGVAYVSLMGNKEEIKKVEIQPLKIEKVNSIENNIESIKQIPINFNIEIQEIEQFGRYDYVPFDYMKKNEEIVESIKRL